MHFYFISTVPEWGGSEVLWMQAAAMALESGHRVSVAVTGRQSLEPPLEKLRHLGAEVHYKPINQKFPGIGERIYRKIIRRPWCEGEWWLHLGLEDADLLCVNQGGAYCAMDQAGLCKAILESRVPYVLLGRCDSLFPHIQDGNRDAYRQFFLGAELYVAASRSTLDLARLQLAGDFKNSAAIHSPIADHSAAVAGYPSGGAPYRMACVARYSQNFKGQHLLLQCLAGQKWRDRPLEVDFYGAGPDAQRLLELTRYLKLQGRVNWMGHTANLGAVWARAHLAVQPSLVEGAPQSILEAMLCSRAALATAVGGIPEWIIEGETGFVAEAPTVPALDRALERAWAARENWESLGKAARCHCLAARIGNPAAVLWEKLMGLCRINESDYKPHGNSKK